jgi:hypothetical protein
MKTPGQLSNPEAMLIQSIRFFWRAPMTTVMDLAAAETVYQNATVVQMVIGNKQYGPWPLWQITSGARLTGCNVGITDCFYTQPEGPLYPLFPNLMLSPLQPFSVYLRTTPQSLPTMAISFPTAAGPIGLQVMLDGQLARSIQ